MAEKLQDSEDRLLASMFRTETVDDDGFSERAIRRIRWQLWVRRLALPGAMLVGTAIAVKPALQLLNIGSQVLGSLADKIQFPGAELSADLPVILVVGLAFALVMTTFRLFEE
jgi:hypothetical protein